jgi:hypothetical protein
MLNMHQTPCHFVLEKYTEKAQKYTKVARVTTNKEPTKEKDKTKQHEVYKPPWDRELRVWS